MASTEDNKKNRRLQFLLLGTALGAMLGILFAPAKGRDTRSSLRELFNSFLREPFEEQNESFDKQDEDIEMNLQNSDNND